MYYYKARMYSPTLGRFMQTDPIGYGDGPNWYAYAHGDPIDGRDPSGLEVCDGTNDATCDEIVVTAKKRKTKGIGGGGDFSFGKFFGNISAGRIFGGGGSGAAAAPMPHMTQTPTCSSVLPNGKTIGQIVQSALSGIQGGAGDYDIGGAGEFGAFIATVQSRGPIDFKNNFRGQANAGFLGAAGNFAYGAIASGIGYSQSFAEAGAGAYALKNRKLNGNNPFGEDNSAAQNLPAGFASNGCSRR